MRSVRWSYLAAGLTVAACNEDEKPNSSTADCMSADLAYSEALANDQTLEQLASCSTDADCELWNPWVHCPAGGMFSRCQRATRVGNVMASEVRRDEIAASTVCAPGAPLCAVGTICPMFVPRCVERSCTVVVGVPDAGR